MLLKVKTFILIISLFLPFVFGSCVLIQRKVPPPMIGLSDLSGEPITRPVYFSVVLQPHLLPVGEYSILQLKNLQSEWRKEILKKIDKVGF